MKRAVSNHRPFFITQLMRILLGVYEAHMKMRTKAQQIAFGIKLGLNRDHAALLASLKTPSDVQSFIAAIPANYEVGGETCMSAAQALTENRAHCIEAAFIAACALWMQGRTPLLLDLKARLNDSDHVVALYKEGNYWGALSKSNHVWLRWRDPVYRTMRELAISYFHEFTMRDKKTLFAFSKPFDLRKVDPAIWVSGTHKDRDGWDVAWDLDQSPHSDLFPKSQIKHIRDRDPVEMQAHQIVEHKIVKQGAPKKRK